MTNKVIHGDNLEVLKTYPENFFHSVVTDPPYGLKFMNKHWDYDVPQVEFWREVLRVLKPGGYVLSFGGTRTYHRMVVNIEDAGFIIRDQLQWIYGSGFPKSLNISKAIDRHLKADRQNITETKTSEGIFGTEETEEQIWTSQKQGKKSMFDGGKERLATYPATYPATVWEGYGTALKPANEPICLAMKPLSEKNFAENVLKHQAGGLNIDGCRVGESGARFNGRNVDSDIYGKYGTAKPKEDYGKGRFPSNVILDEEAGGMLNGEARFFYCSKASSSERNAGMRWDSERGYTVDENKWTENDYRKGNGEKTKAVSKNHHATVKPLSLMRYLVRLITPKGGIVLEPFAGSGTTLLAAKKEGFEFVGIERELEYCKIAEQRLESVAINETLF